MKHSIPTNINSSITSFSTVMVFRNQQLMDLWINEMREQIMHGLLKAKNSNWLYFNTAHILGDKTEVIVDSTYRIGRKTFILTKNDWECMETRVMEENGFANKKEAVKAWKEILRAIQNARLMTLEERELYVDEPFNRKRSVLENLRKESETVFEKLTNYFGEKNVDKNLYRGMVIITNQINGVSISVCPKYFEELNKVAFTVSIREFIQVRTFEEIIEAVELFKNFYIVKEKLTYNVCSAENLQITGIE